MTEISQIPFTLGSGLSGSGGALTLDPSFLRSYLAGLQLSNDSTSPNTVLDISAGVCVDSTNAYFIKLGAFTKSTAGAWASGSGSNGMGTGLTVAADTWYHIFAILKGGAYDIYFDTSVTAANAPAGTVAFRRIGSIATDGNAHIVLFSQNGDEFLWSTPYSNYDGTPSSSPISFVVSVPTGVEVCARFRAFITSTSEATGVIFYSPDQAPMTFFTPAGNSSLVTNIQSGAMQVSGDFTVRTNTSQQITLASFETAYPNLALATYGWIDRRGRDN
jgi:hypothetical protein